MKNHLAFRFFGGACVFLLMAGCRPAPDQSDGEHEHEHEEKTAQITVWTGSYEVFAEHTPPVAQKITTFG